MRLALTPIAAAILGGNTLPRPALDLDFAAIGAPIAGQDGRAAPWWNLFRGGVSEPDVFFDGNGVLSYGAHNILLRSEDFANSAWGVFKTAAKVGGTITTPNGITLYRVNVGSDGGPMSSFPSCIFQNLTLAGATTYTFFVVVQAVSGTVPFRLAANVAPAVNAASSDLIATTTPQVFSLTWTTTTSTTAFSGDLTIRAATAGGVVGDIYVGGAQLNLGSTALPYLPTTSTPIWSTVPRITYSGNSLATMNGPDGLVRWKPHNLFLWSQNFANDAWTKANCTVAASPVLAPDGTQSAWLVTSTGNDCFVFQATATTNLLCNFSAFARRGNSDWIAFSNAGFFAYFDIQNGVVGTVQDGAATIQPVGNGWFRCSWTPATLANNGGWRMRCAVSNGSVATTNQTAHFWAPQLNQGPLQPYYPTGSSAYFGPRFIYDPVTLAAQGLLVEEQRTNLVFPSVPPTTNVGSWGINGTATAGLAAPDASASAITYVAPGGGDNGYRLSHSLAGSTTYTAYIYLRPGTAPFLMLRPLSVSGGSSPSVSGSWFNLATRQAASRGSGVTAHGYVQNAARDAGGNVWDLAWCTFTTEASINLNLFDIRVTAGDGTNTGPTTGADIRLWHTQIEAGSFRTTPIPTTSASVTRLADSAQMTGASFSSWWNSQQGTFAARFIGGPAAGGSIQGVFGACDVSADAIVDYRSGQGAALVRAAGQSAAILGYQPIPAGRNTAIAFSYSSVENVFRSDMPGAFAAAGQGPIACDRLGIGTVGNTLTGGLVLNAPIARIRYFNRALSANQLQRLTA